MRKLFQERQVVYLGVMLCLAASLIACNKTPRQNATSNQTSTTQSSTASVSRDSSSSPMAAYRLTFEAMKRGDLEAYKRGVTQATLDLVEETAKRSGLSLDEALRQTMTNTPLPETVPEMRNERIAGDTATIEVNVANQWVTIPYAKENGEWKLAMERSQEITISDK
jgi:hypothetical protein